MNPQHVFLLGCAGALAPEIVRLYAIRTQPSRFNWSSFYVIISVLFAGLGGLLAIALPATTYWGAIYVGVSTPVLVNTILKKAAAEPATRALPRVTPAPANLRSFLSGL